MAERIETMGAPEGGLSLVRGTTDVPMLELTIPGLLRAAVKAHGAREALVFPGQEVRLSYRAFAERVDALAAGFLALGLKQGDRVGIWSPNRLEWVLTQFATARIGVILVNINPAYRVTELEYALNKVGCVALVTAARFKSSDYLAMLRDLAPELATATPGQLQAARLPALRAVIAMGEEAQPGMLRFDDVARTPDVAALDAIEATLDPADAINIQFTSGTTGRPKGATLTHRNIVNNAAQVTARIHLTEADRLCIPVPLYHCFGMVMGVLGAVSKGAAMIFPGEAFEPSKTLDVLAAERCTACYGVPTMFLAMLQDLEDNPRDLTSLRTGIMAGALCPVEIMRKVQARMHMTEVTICYGMTETSPVSFQSFTDDPLDKRCETVGRVHPHLEVKIVGEDGAIVPVGQRGELCTRGYSVMQGYWDEPEKTAESIRDGWMFTGDLAEFDEQGFCSIVGRVKDMIIRGGENVYPREVEEFLMSHPKVADVQVFGVPDEKYGEEVCAWVVPERHQEVTPEEMRAFAKDRIAHFKVPRFVRIVTEFPLTVTGKPQKFIMRDKEMELQGRA